MEKKKKKNMNECTKKKKIELRYISGIYRKIHLYFLGLQLIHKPTIDLLLSLYMKIIIITYDIMKYNYCQTYGMNKRRKKFFNCLNSIKY